MNGPGAVAMLVLGAFLLATAVWLATGRSADVRTARSRQVPDVLGEHFADCPEPVDWVARERELAGERGQAWTREQARRAEVQR